MPHTEHHDHVAKVIVSSASVSGHDRRALDAIFRHPLSHNLSWREVVILFKSIGDADERRSGDYLFRIGDDSFLTKRPHDKNLSGQDVMDLRHFLTRAGWSPEGGPSAGSGPEAHELDLIVVIDHAGARVYRIDGSVAEGRELASDHDRHLVHHLERARRDEDRDELYPDDEAFFEGVAAVLASAGKIVLISHGKGQSNEGGHLGAYLLKHHKGVHARIVREIVADIPHLTPPELLRLGRDALA